MLLYCGDLGCKAKLLNFDCLKAAVHRFSNTLVTPFVGQKVKQAACEHWKWTGKAELLLGWREAQPFVKGAGQITAVLEEVHTSAQSW